jgi:hypothetical protein
VKETVKKAERTIISFAFSRVFFEDLKMQIQSPASKLNDKYFTSPRKKKLQTQLQGSSNDPENVNETARQYKVRDF